MGSGDILSRQFSQSLFHEADRAAERPPPAHAGVDLDRVFLDLHAVAAAVPHLPPREIAIYVRYPDQKAGRHAFDDSHQKLAM
jgi:hypothetical protein